MTLHDLNILPKDQLKQELLKCCGSNTWAEKMLSFFPAEDMVEILEDAEEQWFKCSEADWREAFAQHPKIGDVDSLKKKFASTADWASTEQGEVKKASEEVLRKLAEENKKYEDKFGYIFIVCATGKSAEEILTLLEMRLNNSPEVEIQVAADEQNLITKLRIEKLLE